MLRNRLFHCAIAAAMAASVSLAAQSDTFMIRVGALIPDNSPWTTAIRSMGPALMKATDKRVNLSLFPNAGTTERLILAKMNLSPPGIDAATVSVPGLALLDKSFNAFAMPFFFESDAEVEYVLAKMTPFIQQKLEAKHYHLINWGNGGWVRLFSKEPLKTVADIKNARLYTSNDDQDGLKWYESQGFHAVQVQTSQIASQLALGKINATPSPPVYAAASQIFRSADHMLDVPMGPLLAATIMSDQAWSKLSAADRATLLEVGAATQKSIADAAPGLDARYITQMKGLKLDVVTLDAGQLNAFRAEAEKLIQSQRDVLVPADAFAAVMRERDAYRKTKK